MTTAGATGSRSRANQILFAACAVVSPLRRRPSDCQAATDVVILSATDGKVLAGCRSPAVPTAVQPRDEAFSSQGNGTMTIVKEKSPTSFDVGQT